MGFDAPDDPIELDKSLFKLYQTRTYTVLKRDPPTYVDARTGARVWRLPYTREVAIALVQSLVHGHLCDSVRAPMPALLDAMEYEGVHVPGMPSVLANTLPKIQLARSLGHAGRKPADKALAKVTELMAVVAQALVTWRRLDSEMSACAQCGASGSEITCSATRVWVRFAPLAAPGRGDHQRSTDRLHNLALKQPTWFRSMLYAMGDLLLTSGAMDGNAFAEPLPEAPASASAHAPAPAPDPTLDPALDPAPADGAAGGASRNNNAHSAWTGATFRLVAELMESEKHSVFHTWHDPAWQAPLVAGEQPLNETQLSRLQFVDEFALQICKTVVAFGPVLDSTHKVPLKTKFARACCSLAEKTFERSACLARLLDGRLQDTSGGTPERTALEKALKKRKVVVRQWADAEPYGVEAAVFPPALADRAAAAVPRVHPCALLEFQ